MTNAWIGEDLEQLFGVARSVNFEQNIPVRIIFIQIVQTNSKM